MVPIEGLSLCVYVHKAAIPMHTNAYYWTITMEVPHVLLLASHVHLQYIAQYDFMLAKRSCQESS